MPSGRPLGLDYGAIMQMGMALRVDTALLAATLPGFEVHLINGLTHSDDDDTDEIEDDDG